MDCSAHLINFSRSEVRYHVANWTASLTGVSVKVKSSYFHKHMQRNTTHSPTRPQSSHKRCLTSKRLTNARPSNFKHHIIDTSAVHLHSPALLATLDHFIASRSRPHPRWPKREVEEEQEGQEAEQKRHRQRKLSCQPAGAEQDHAATSKTPR